MACRQARELEKSTPLEFASAANNALGNRSSTPAAPLTAALRNWLPQSGGGESGNSGGNDFRQPPLVTGWVGGPPRSFPLQLRHAGR